MKRLIYSGRQALQLIFLTLFAYPWQTDEITRVLGNKCYCYNYQGIWETVQDFLETEFSDPYDFCNKYIEIFGPHDFFGNFLREAEKEAERIGWKKVISVTQDRRPIKKKIRRRGYSDKGTLRLPHQYHGEDLRNSDEEREDRRSKIRHPLLN